MKTDGLNNLILQYEQGGFDKVGVDETYEAMVADVHPKFKKAGCTDMEARFAMRNPLCPELILGFPLIPGDEDKCKIRDGNICYLELGEPCAIYNDYLAKLEVK